MKTSDTRSMIVQAAGELAVEHGLGNFSANQVAEAAGVSRRTLFNHFSSIGDAVDEYLGDLMASKLDYHDAHAPLHAPFAEVCGELVDHLRSKETYACVELIHATLRPTDPRDTNLAWRARMAQRVTSIISAQLRPFLDWDDIEIDIFAHGIVSAIETTYVLWVRNGEATYDAWLSILNRVLTPLPRFSVFDRTER